MPEILNVLCLEDSPRDAELIRELLSDSGYKLNMDCTTLEKEFVSFLQNGSYDIILSDFKLPGFDAFSALKWSVEICPEVPFICVSGTVGEETAIELLRKGAVDYILKDRLIRLPSAIQRAITEAKEKKALQQAKEKISQQYYTLKCITESSGGPFFSLDRAYRYTSFNKAHSSVMKLIYDVDIEIGISLFEYQRVENDKIKAKANLDRALSGENVEERAWSGNDVSSQRLFEVTHNPIFNEEKEVIGVAVNARDITEREKLEAKLKESEELYGKLFHNMLNGFSYCRMLYDNGSPSDFVYLGVNTAFETQTGLKNVIGKKVSEVIPGVKESDPELFERYGRVALTGNPEVFETYLVAMKMWFTVSVYSPEKEYFVAVFDVITERKIAEEHLRETNEYLSNLFNYANAPIIVWNTSLIITQFNHAFERLSGYFEEEVLGKKIDILFSKDKAKSSLELISRAVSGERWETVEIEIQRKDGDSRIVLWNSANILDKEGKTVIATIAQGNDITKRKTTENELRESENKFRQTFDLSPVGIVMAGLNKAFIRCNNAFSKSLGYSPDELIGKTFTEVTHPEDRQIGIAEMNTILSGEALSVSVQKRYIRKDGQVVWGEVLISLMRDSNGSPQYFLSIIQDITERKYAVEALRESEDKFKYIFDHSVIGKSITLPSGEINVNNTFCKMLGYSAKELENKKWQEISHADDIDFTQKTIDSLTSGEKESVRFTKRYIHKNGSVVWTELATSLRRDLDGKPLYFMTAIVDITERKNAEEKLRLKNLVFDSSLAANSISDINGNITEVNEAFMRIWGCRTKDDVIGKPNSSFILNDEEVGTIMTALQNVGEWEGDYTGRRIDGTTFIAHGLATIIKDEKGTPVGYQSAVLDITERKQIEEQIANLALRQDAILSAVPDIIMEVDNNKKYTWANHSGYEFFGNEVIGMDASYYFEGEQDTYKDVQPLFNGSNDIIYLESWQRRKDGKKRLLAWWCRVLKDEKGNIKGALSTARDITESRQLTIQIEEERNKLASLLSSIPDEVWFADSDKKFTLANPNALLEFGLKSTDNLDIEKFAEGLEVFLPDGTPRSTEEAPPLRALKGEIIKNFEEVVLIPASKELRHRQVNAAPVKDAAGRIIGAISVVRDITELKESEKKIKQLNEELEQRVIERTEQLEAANKELEAFSYSVSHDLRAPLRAIHSYTKILLEEYENKLDNEGKRLFGIVYSSASQMGELIDDLLNLSRIGRSSMSLSLVDMKKIVRTAYDELITQKEKDKIVFKIEKMDKANVDNILIKQVWINLLSNSIKYSSKKENPEISIGSYIRDNMIIYFIKDNGVGFDMTYKHKLFGVFQRLHTEKEFEGNGVGLAIVQRIINRHGGKVWADGEVGKGATFYFSLPIQDKR
jgi:PAS domain S-box-containing protein